VAVTAPAKINLSLGVGPRRPDGFHALATVYQAIGLYDQVTVSAADELTVTVRGDRVDVSEVPTDDRNIACRAARLLAEQHGIDPGATIAIDKGIPVAGGMAGGSADAAAVLVALDALWNTGATRGELAGLAAQLGSDVPFSLLGGVALGSGRGEQLSPVLARRQTHWVLGIAREGLSTPAVYAELDRLRATGRLPDGTDLPSPQPVIAALSNGPASALAEAVTNDLEAPAIALRPELRRALRAATDAGALAAFLSGSGPTVAALVEDEDAAVRLAATLAGEGHFRTLRVVHGPVPGARLVG
jgi:4-diphosphocytidyl-2-C-methyl-D-erythritol kinase